MVSSSPQPQSLQSFSRTISTLPRSLQFLLREYIGQSFHSLASSLVRVSSLLQHLTTVPETLTSDTVPYKLIREHLTSLLESNLSAEDEHTAARGKLLEGLTPFLGGSQQGGFKWVLETPVEELVSCGGSSLGCLEINKSVQELLSTLSSTGEPVDVRLNLRDRQVYEGGMFCGRKEGRGRLVYANGDLYVGDWVRGLREGQGEYTWKTGAKYVGQYVRNLREGRGRFQFADESTYDGGWKDGMRHGKGLMIWENGDSYEGDFVKSVRTGKGKFVR